MEAKQAAVLGAGAVAVAGLGWMTKRFLQKRAIKKAITPEVVATAQSTVEMSRINANNQLIATLKQAAAKKVADQSPLEKCFDAWYNRIDTLLDFDPRWKNGTGYFNGAMTVGLANGNMAKATGDCGRRLIMIGTEHGTAVFFERYTIGHGPFVVVHNTASQFREEVPNGSLSVEQFNDFLTKYMK
jgi:hypothetical protein